MRPLYVESEHLSTERIGYVRHEEEAALSIGAYRLPTSTTDLGALKEDVIIYKKIAEAAEHAFRDVMARIAWLENREEQRRLAAAHNHAPAVQPTPAPASASVAPVTQPVPAAKPAPCRCGQPAAPSMVHRQDAPCHPIGTKPCPTCQGNGCPTCSGSGIADLNPPEQTRHLQPVVDGGGDARAPMSSTTAFHPPARPPAAAPGR